MVEAGAVPVTFRTPEVMFQMMADTSRFAHAGSGNDDFRCPVKVDGGGVLRGDGKVQTGELKGVDALFHQFHGGSVETVQTVFHEYPCGFNGKGTVDEIMAACNYHLVPEEWLQKCLQGRQDTLEVVLTGRNPSQKLIDMADYVSEIQMCARAPGNSSDAGM